MVYSWKGLPCQLSGILIDCNWLWSERRAAEDLRWHKVTLIDDSTHWERNKIVDILRTIFPNAFFQWGNSNFTLIWIELHFYDILFLQDIIVRRISTYWDPMTHICVNPLRPRQHGRHFTYGIFKHIFLNEKWVNLIKIDWSSFLKVYLAIFQHWFR